MMTSATFAGSPYFSSSLFQNIHFYPRNSLLCKEETTILSASDMACGPRCENERV